MKPTFIILSFSALLVIFLLFYFGKTYQPQDIIKGKIKDNVQSFDIQSFIQEKTNQLSPDQKTYLRPFSTSASDSASLIKQAEFWKDSANVPAIAAYYYGLLAKLVKSEKNLNFASQFYIDCIRAENDGRLLDWESEQAITLFDDAIERDSSNVDLKIGRASCFIFGKGRSGDPQQTMQGVLSLLDIVRKDSANMKAQKLLGIGGFISGQYDKAIPRLEKVLNKKPDDVEAMIYLADSYAAKGEIDKAVGLYNESKKMMNDQHYNEEVDRRIKELEKEKH